MSVLAVFGCRGRISSDETETSVFTLDADVELNDITLRGKLLSSVDLAQVSKAGFLVSESESFPSGQTLEFTGTPEADGSFASKVSVDALGGKRGAIFFYKAQATIAGKNDAGKVRSFVCPVIEVESIALSSSTARLDMGGTLQLTATVKPDNATDKVVIWASSAPAVATVSETGLVTAVSGGHTDITASCGGKTATCSISVKGAQPAGSVDMGFGPYWSANILMPENPSQYYRPAYNGPWYQWGMPDALAKWEDFSKYDMSKFSAISSLPSQFDAATARLGGSWRLPTRAELQELLDNCDFVLSGSRTGWYDVFFKSKVKTYSSLRLGTEGYIPSNGFSVSGAGSPAYFWSSTTNPDKPEEAYAMHYDYKNYVSPNIVSIPKDYACSILPVAD